MKRVASIFCGLSLLALAAFAQSPDTQNQTNETGFLTDLIQNQLSGPGREISLSGVSGLLSSQATIVQITVSDDDGPWLEINDAELDWTRSALLVGQVRVNLLKADRISWLRKPDIPPKPATPETGEPFSLPELPVSISLQELQIGRIDISEEALGQSASLSASGSLSLESGALDGSIDVTRIDTPGGSLNADVSFENETREIGLDVRFQEPSGGIVAQLLRLEDDPAIDLRIAGQGPLDDVDIDLSLEAGGEQLLDGAVAMRRVDDGQGFDASFVGQLSPLIPEPYRDFFSGQTQVDVRGVSKSEGGLRVDSLAITGDEIEVSGSVDTAEDFFPQRLSIVGSIGDPTGPVIRLPIPGSEASLHSAELYVSYGAASRWDGFIFVDRLSARDVDIEDITLRLGGVAENLDTPESRNVSIELDGLATGVRTSDGRFDAGQGERIDLAADIFMPPNAPIEIREMKLNGGGLELSVDGQAEGLGFTGNVVAIAPDLELFSAFAGRSLGGALNLRANGSFDAATLGFDLSVDGEVDEIDIGDPRLAALLAGSTLINGRAVRDDQGIRVDGLQVNNQQLSIASDGVISSDKTDVSLDAELFDLSELNTELAGDLSVSGTATGAGTDVEFELAANIVEGRAFGNAVDALKLDLTGNLEGKNLTASVSGDGMVANTQLSLAGDIVTSDETRRLSGLRLEVGSNVVSGDLEMTPDGMFDGEVNVDAPDISLISEIAPVDAQGALKATANLTIEDGGQNIALNGRGDQLALGSNSLKEFEADLSVTDVFRAPIASGELSVSDAIAGGIDIASASITATAQDSESSEFDADVSLGNGTQVGASGALSRLDPGYSVDLKSLDVSQGALSAALEGASEITLQDGGLKLSPLKLNVGDGFVTAEGDVSDDLRLDVEISSLPLDIANAFVPALGLEGMIDGSAQISGSREKPEAEFDLTASAIATSATRSAGLPPVNLDATGRTSGGDLDVTANLGGDGGLAADVSGKVPLSGGDMDLSVNLASFPLALVDRLAGGQGLRGQISGTAEITGPLDNPSAKFDVNGDGLTATVLEQSGVSAMQLALSGAFEENALNIETANLNNAQGLGLSASGSVPLSGDGLDVAVNGEAPLEIADAALAFRDAQASGIMRIDASARGSLTSPDLAGSVSISGGTLVDPGTNIRLENITLNANLSGNSVVIEQFDASLGGGTARASGSVSLDGAAGNPADMELVIDGVRYTDGTLVTTEINADLTLSGPLQGGGGTLAGRIDLGKTEISIAEGLGADAAAALEQVIHEFPPPRVVQTLERARVEETNTPQASGRSGLNLDIQVNAPRQIFVRGRGLDAELFGELRIQGTTTDIQPVGEFELRRGRITVLTQRIDFTQGSMTLIGDLDPEIFFQAESRSSDVTAIVTVEGRASDPEINFTSQPELPEDEVLARLLFNRASQDLSAFQYAQLAAAAAQLAGGGSGPGILGELRGATGLDNLDIITEDDGTTAVSAGKYLSDDVYVDVQTGSDGVSQAEVNLDISDRITARGAFGTDGNTRFGIFYQRDY